MSSIIKEAVLGGLKEWINSEGDHTLRVARIKGVRLLLDGLEETANREIKPIDFPLWHFDESYSRYGAASDAVSDYSFFLIREDVDPEVLKWASDATSHYMTNWYVRADGIGSDFPAGKPHPLYPRFQSMVAFGNKVSPIKRYYKANGRFRYSTPSVRAGLLQRLGDRCWTKDTLPLDVNGNRVVWG